MLNAGFNRHYSFSRTLNLVYFSHVAEIVPFQPRVCSRRLNDDEDDKTQHFPYFATFLKCLTEGISWNTS